MKRSLSMDCLSSSPSSSPHSSCRLVSVHENCEIKTSINGYLSDGLIGKAQEKRKETEHRNFLNGLEKLGKGDWRGISRKFVSTRTPTQVASHAQKYFLRQACLNHKKRRASLFDMDYPYGPDLRAGFRRQTKQVGAKWILPDLPATPVFVSATPVASSSNPIVVEANNVVQTSSNHRHSAEALDLELALGAPKDVDKPKPSSTSMLLGPISVT
nr:myb-like protein J isoform X2 [Ipomoea trifida]